MIAALSATASGCVYLAAFVLFILASLQILSRQPKALAMAVALIGLGLACAVFVAMWNAFAS